MKKVIVYSIIIFLCYFSINKIVAQEINHKPWEDLLKTYVTPEGNISYADFNKNALDNYLVSLQENPPDSGNKNETLSYWINAYNAYTIKLILDNYPIKSIRDIPNSWDIKFIPYKGGKISLNHIENEILRKMGDSRIHFAINCASVSCPKLLNDAFYSNKLDEQLNIVTKNFINNQAKNNITQDNIRISEIFNWFKQDFEQGKTLIEFINQYSIIKIDKDASITYMDYNWNLNKK